MNQINVKREYFWDSFKFDFIFISDIEEIVVDMTERYLEMTNSPENLKEVDGAIDLVFFLSYFQIC